MAKFALLLLCLVTTTYAIAGSGTWSRHAIPMSYSARQVRERCGASAPALPLNPPTAGANLSFGGTMGERLAASVHNWLLVAPRANPAILQMFRDRERTPRRDLVPWAGEFAGKYLTSAVQTLRATGDKQLKTSLERFVKELIATQDSDGYLGPFPKSIRMTKPGPWDLWGQYHVMLGLLIWYRETGDHSSLQACRRCADLFCRTFLDSSIRVADAASEEMNESSIHIFTQLYIETGEPRYLRMAREIEKDWERPPSGDYVRSSLAGKAFWQCPKPRWESLHSIEAIADFYRITREQKYRRAFEQVWWSIVECDRHNTGGFSSGEQATGNPYDPRPIETCCTVAWMAVTVDMLKMTGDLRAADELEISTWNATLGAQSASGRWWTYNTPMDGERRASAHDIVFQARAGSPELNCCSLNGPRALGMLSEWAVAQNGRAVVVNYYGASRFDVGTPGGNVIRLTQQTDYPADGRVRLRVEPKVAEALTIRFRIPGWSRKTTVEVNGQPVRGVSPGIYLDIARTWHHGDSVKIELDMAPWIWVGEREAAGKVSIYSGPVLLAHDPRFDTLDPANLPKIDVKRLASSIKTIPTTSNSESTLPSPILLCRIPTADGKQITLCDFASAGAAGNRYVSWLPAAGLKPVAFSRHNPLRIGSI